MSRLRFALLAAVLLFCLVTSCIGPSASISVTPDNSPGMILAPGEMRGAWIHSPYGLEGMDWDATIKLLADNGFNAVFPNLAWGYCAEYPSNVLPTHPNLLNADGTTRDLLKECSDACRKYGIQLHLWKVCWNMGHRTPDAFKQEMRDAKRTQIGADGSPSDYLAPHLAANLDLEINAITEIVTKYHIDGIHLDYIRYPGSTFDYSPSAREAFTKATGITVGNWPADCQPNGKNYRDFHTWRCQNISRAVSAISKAVKRANPATMVSAAVYTNWESAPVSIGQKPQDWIRASYLDFICPMDYFDQEAAFRACLDKQLEFTAGRTPIYAGIGTFKCADAAEVIRQIRASRQLGADGFICFQLNKRFANEILPVIHEELTKSPALFIPHTVPAVSCIFNPQGRLDFLSSPSYSTTTGCMLEINRPDRFTPAPKCFHLWRDNEYLEDSRLTIRATENGWIARIKPGAPAGCYRIVIQGMLPGGSHFYRQTPSFHILSTDETQEALRKIGIPNFAGNGKVKIGVWTDNSYGSAPILAWLKSLSWTDAAELGNLSEATLKACQLVILPQPRQNTTQFKDEVLAKRLHDLIIQNGIGVMTTHTLTGANDYIIPVPELIRQAVMPPIPKAPWRLRPNPATRLCKLTTGTTSFVDYITLVPTSDARTMVTAPGPNGPVPVVVGGPIGYGCYVACGFGLGIGPGDVDCDLTPDEKTLFEAILKWMSRNSRKK